VPRIASVVIVTLLVSLPSAPAAAQEKEEMGFKDDIDPAWEGNFDNLVGVLDKDLRECDLLIATPETDDAKTLDVWTATTAARSENYQVLAEAALADGQLYLDGVSEYNAVKRARYEAALEAARRWKEAYDWFLLNVVRAGGIVAVSFVRDANRVLQDSEAMRDGAADIFEKLREYVGKADEDLGKIEAAVRNARSRRELDEQERKLEWVAVRVKNARFVLLVRKSLADDFFGTETYEDLAELLQKALDRYEKAAKNEKMDLVLQKHRDHVELWKKLLMQRWKDCNAAFGEADQRWQPFNQQTLFDSLPYFKGVPYADLDKPVEAMRKRIAERRRDLR
jgi:hypothetical protein